MFHLPLPWSFGSGGASRPSPLTSFHKQPLAKGGLRREATMAAEEPKSGEARCIKHGVACSGVLSPVYLRLTLIDTPDRQCSFRCGWPGLLSLQLHR